MTFCFICSCLEPGKDGVGDYTRRLAGELIRQGHKASILALHDSFVATYSVSSQVDAQTNINVVRIPKTSDFFAYKDQLESFIKENIPDIFSLQFVPYGFQDKGLPFKLGKFLKQISNGKTWHIMFHELWVGMEKTTPFKNKLYGIVQKQIINKLLKVLNPKLIHTSIEVYKYQIEQMGYKATILPLISNVIKSSETQILSKENLPVEIGVFGTIYPNSKLNQFLQNILQVHPSKDIKFHFIGKNGNEYPKWEEILKEYNISFSKTGFLSEEKIGEYIQKCDYGLSTTSFLLAGKSGSIAAFRDNKIPVICIGHDWEIKDKKVFPELEGIIDINYLNLKLLPELTNLDISIKTIAKTFVQNINRTICNPKNDF